MTAFLEIVLELEAAILEDSPARQRYGDQGEIVGHRKGGMGQDRLGLRRQRLR